MSYIKNKKILMKYVGEFENEEEKRKIFPTDTVKKDELDDLIKEEIKKEFHILLQKELLDDKDENLVKNFVKDYIKKNKYFFHDYQDGQDFIDMIINDIFGLGILEGYINDPTIQEIWVIGPTKIYYESNGKRIKSPLKFKNSKIIVSMINKILAPINRKADESTPLADARLADGSRVAVTMSPISLSGPEIVIRKFKKDKFLLNDYIRIGSINQNAADFLANSVRWGANILIVGGTGSGKTTLLNALTNEIPSDRGAEKIITIEDSAELIVFQDFVSSWETKNNNSEGTGECTPSQLVKHSLRNSPDRIILGEIRDAVAYDVLQAASTGHKGTMSTIHADNASKAVERFSVLAGSSGIITPIEAKKMFADAFDLIVVVGKVDNPKTNEQERKIIQISQIVGCGYKAADMLKVKGVGDENHLYLQDIYSFDKKNFSFETSGYLPKKLIEKAKMENRDYDLKCFKIGL